jgi:peptidyl-prolyl cis-trans isomerase A (cyclophilin A)
MLRHLPIAALIWAAVSCTPEKPEEHPKRSEIAEPQATPPSNQVLLTTSLGEIIIELDPDKAPVSVTNFLSYVDSGHYDSTLFHRTISGYLIEGGKMHLDGDAIIERTPNALIENESKNGLRNERGTLAMARAARPDSATSAFFINLADNLALNYPQPDGNGYAVFGKVVSGMAIADQIGRSLTDVKPLTLIHPATGKPEAQEVADVPIEPVTILSAKRIAK